MIADELGCSLTSVASASNRHGVTWNGRVRFPQLHDPDWLQTRLADTSLDDLAGELGCSPNAVRQAAKRVGITRIAVLRRPYPLLDNQEWLTRRYITEQRTLAQIATELGCSPTTVARAVTRQQLPRRTRRYPQLDDRAWLRTQLARRSVANRRHRTRLRIQRGTPGSEALRDPTARPRLRPAPLSPTWEAVTFRGRSCCC